MQLVAAHSPDPHRRAMILGSAVGAVVAASAWACASKLTDRDPAQIGIHVPAARKHTVEIGPGLHTTVQVSAAVVGGGFTVTESLVAPGAATLLHFNEKADETLLVLNGILDIVCGGAWIRAVTGSTVFLPKGAHHGFINRSEGPVLCLSVFSPGGIETLLSKWPAAPVEQRADLARRHGVRILGPLLST